MPSLATRASKNLPSFSAPEGTAGPGADVEIAKGRPERREVAAFDPHLEAARLQRLEPAADAAEPPGILGGAPRPQVAHGDRRLDVRAHRPVMMRLGRVHDLEGGRVAAAELLEVDHVPAVGPAS